MKFDWDERKTRKNLRDHGLSFEDVKTAFLDPGAVILEDLIDDDGEQRYQLIGFADRVSLLLVVHSYRASDDETWIRIISTRKATAYEREVYRAANSRP